MSGCAGAGRGRRLRPGRAGAGQRPRRPAPPRRQAGAADGDRAALVPGLGRQAEARPRRPHGQGGAAPGRRRPRHRDLAAHRPPPRRRPDADGRAWPTAPGRSGGSGPARGWTGSGAASTSATPQHGEVAFLLEPDLKEGRGGLRDVHALSWAALAADDLLAEGDEQALREAYEVLLAARVELHRLHRPAGRRAARCRTRTGWPARLGFADADLLMAAVSAAARTIAWISDEAWHRVRVAQGEFGKWDGREQAVAPGVSARLGEVRLDDDADPARDPTLLLRVATAAARKRLHIDRRTLDRLAAEMPTWPDPWPAGASDELVALLLEGHDAIPVLESLDQRGLISTRCCPSGRRCGPGPQRNAYHRFTVDRHLWEAAANAAELADRVPRPDLLVLGALLHDLGKGYPGDHTIVGIELVERIGHRLGLSRADIDVLATLVRHHLLLPDVATRRDLDDDGDDQRGGRGRRLASGVLELLAALTEADSLATGPSAWGSWKAELVAELVDRVGHVLGGGELERRHLVAVPVRAASRCSWASERTTVMAEGDRDHRRGPRPARPLQPGRRRAGAPRARRPRRPGPLGRAGHGGQRVPGAALPATASSTGRGWRPTWSGPSPGSWPSRPAWPSGPAPTAAGGRSPPGPAGPTVRIDNEASSNATVVEVRAPRPHRRPVPDHQGPRRPRPRHPPRQGADARGRTSSTRSTCATADGQGRPTPTTWPSSSGPCSTPASPDRREPASDLCRPRPIGRVPAVAADEEAIDVDTTSRRHGRRGRRPGRLHPRPPPLERGAGRHRPHRARLHPEPLRAGALRGGAEGGGRHQGRGRRRPRDPARAGPLRPGVDGVRRRGRARLRHAEGGGRRRRRQRPRADPARAAGRLRHLALPDRAGPTSATRRPRSR